MTQNHVKQYQIIDLTTLGNSDSDSEDTEVKLSWKQPVFKKEPAIDLTKEVLSIKEIQLIENTLEVERTVALEKLEAELTDEEKEDKKELADVLLLSQPNPFDNFKLLLGDEEDNDYLDEMLAEMAGPPISTPRLAEVKQVPGKCPKRWVSQMDNEEMSLGREQIGVWRDDESVDAEELTSLSDQTVKWIGKARKRNISDMMEMKGEYENWLAQRDAEIRSLKVKLEEAEDRLLIKEAAIGSKFLKETQYYKNCAKVLIQSSYPTSRMATAGVSYEKYYQRHITAIQKKQDPYSHC